jgi:hypothetical protein
VTWQRNATRGLAVIVALTTSAQEAHTWLMNELLTYSTPHWSNSSWAVPRGRDAYIREVSNEHANFHTESSDRSDGSGSGSVDNPRSRADFKT